MKNDQVLLLLTEAFPRLDDQFATVALADSGALDEAAADRTVRVLLAGSSEPVITKKPSGAWTHAIWDKADIH